MSYNDDSLVYKERYTREETYFMFFIFYFRHRDKDRDKYEFWISNAAVTDAGVLFYLFIFYS